MGILKHFTKDLMHGIVLSLVDHNSRTVDYICHLDPKMTTLTMRPGAGGGADDAKSTKVLVLKEIERICAPQEVRNLRATNPIFLDECCTTVVLTNQRFVTLRLDSVAAREYFMLCLQVLRMSQDQ